MLRSARLIVIVAGLVAGCLAACTSSNSNPHGNPDPGGKRLTFLTQAARQAVPPGATAVHLELKTSHWDPGGCDGGSPGWSRMEAEQVFRTADDVASQVDAAISKAHWQSVPVQGGTAVREYEPAMHKGYGGHGWLFSSARTGRTTWHLNLSAAPAEAPTHTC
jgi:hypothetical protein